MSFNNKKDDLDAKPGGGLWKNNKQKDTHPDSRGHLILDDETVRSIMDQVADPKVTHPKIEVAAWKKISKSNVHYLSLKASADWERSKRYKNRDNANAPEPYNDDLPF